MRTWGARRECLAFALPLALTAACGGQPGEDPRPDDDRLSLGARYLNDAAFRRETLLASLVNPDNGYSRLRIERYTEEAWGALPEWNPLTSPVDVGMVAPPESSSSAWSTLPVEAVAWNEASLVELGRRAFFGFPLQLQPSIAHAVDATDAASRRGLWTNGAALGGAVWTALPAGGVETAVTCSTCHATVENGTLIAGKNNPDLDLPGLVADAQGVAGPSTWLPGRLDVTNDGVDNPTVIADLRAVRSQVNLQRAATVRNGLIRLALRIETLAITALDQAARPPRVVAFALALYLSELEPVPVRVPDDASARGNLVFSDTCAGCHQPPGFSGPPVPLEVVGTDPTVGESPERTTGFYRVPSLRGVGDRRRLFASGDVADLHDLLDPTRKVPGHSFGLSLGAADRADLIAFLETL